MVTNAVDKRICRITDASSASAVASTDHNSGDRSKGEMDRTITIATTLGRAMNTKGLGHSTLNY